MIRQVCVSIQDESQVGHARRTAADLVAGLGMDPSTAGKVGIVVTELARNLVLHGRGGELVLAAHPGGRPRFDVYSIDKGAGMSDPEACLRDGYSTAGTSGAGLGAVKRLSERFSIHSQPGAGTIVVASIWSPRPDPGGMDIGVLSLPKPGEEVPGDDWAESHSDRSTALLVVDGLGHGPQAREAAMEAVTVFREMKDLDPVEYLHLAHGALRKTRGAAVAVAQVLYNERKVCYAGVGNIGAVIVASESSRSLVSHNGTVGHEIRRIQEFSYPFPSGAVLLMYSDGLAGHWSLSRYPGLMTSHPSVIAAVLYRDYSRGRDDVTVLVARERKHA